MTATPMPLPVAVGQTWGARTEYGNAVASLVVSIDGSGSGAGPSTSSASGASAPAGTTPASAATSALRGGIRVRRFLRSRSDVGVRRLRGTWDEVDVRRDLRVRRRLRVRGGPVQICQPVLPRLDTTVDGHGADPRVAGERGARATRQPHGERIDDGKPAGHPAVHAPDGRGAVGERDAVAQLHDVRRPRSALGRAGSREEQRRDHPRDEGRGSKCGRRRREQGCGVSHQRRVIRSRRRALRVRREIRRT